MTKLHVTVVGIGFLRRNVDSIAPGAGAKGSLRGGGRSLTAIESALKVGYPVSELQSEPELLSLRADARYHRLVDRLASRESK